MKPEDIRDIRPPLPIPPWWHWPLAIAVAAIAAFAVVLLVRAWQKRRARERSPLERAQRALRTAEEHARAGRSREWADVISEMVRASLAARLGADILPQTTTELAERAWAEPASEAVSAEAVPTNAASLKELSQFLELLKTCDLARFALASFDVEALVENTAVARRLVEELLAPKPEPEPRVAQRAELSSS